MRVAEFSILGIVKSLHNPLRHLAKFGIFEWSGDVHRHMLSPGGPELRMRDVTRTKMHGPIPTGIAWSPSSSKSTIDLRSLEKWSTC